jgi:hypothetical protein
MPAWEYRVAGCVLGGGRLNTPNGLPVMSIRADGLMSECGEGDHLTYLFPVAITGSPADSYDGYLTGRSWASIVGAQ